MCDRRGLSWGGRGGVVLRRARALGGEGDGAGGLGLWKGAGGGGGQRLNCISVWGFLLH